MLFRHTRVTLQRPARGERRMQVRETHAVWYELDCDVGFGRAPTR